MNNEIYLRRKQKVFLIKNDNRLPNEYLATILKNIENLGYTFSEDIINILKTYNVEGAIDFYKNIIINLKKMLGADVEYKPMYPNFPKQVMKATDIELYLNAIIHYITLGEYKPKYIKEERFPLLKNINSLKIIELGTEEEFNDIFKNLLNSKTSISQEDREDIEWFVKNNSRNIKNILPKKIPLKENVALFSNLLIKYVDNSQKYLSIYYKTATDVLRFAVELSDGDNSLREYVEFKKFKRKERRMLLELLNNCNNIEEDMLRYKNKWIKLGEILHPFEYKTRYKKVYKAFYKIRNKVKIETFNSKVNKYITNKDYSKAIEVLSTRPSEFARNLNYLLKIVDDKIEVINAFKNIAKDVSSTVLLQVMCYFKHRNEYKDIRVFIPKGNVAKIFGKENDLLKIDQNLCDYIVKFCENNLIAKYSLNGDVLGKVYVDKELKNYTVPFSQRSASKSLKTISRGSKFTISKDSNIIRTFIYWKDGYDRTDIDLSVVLYDSNWNYITHVSYTELRDIKNGIYHSGDITSAPDGASEFIDIDLNKVRQNNIRYAIISVNSYTEQPYCDLPICYVGWMNRKESMSGEIYEPTTVSQKFDLTSNSEICIPIIIDFENDNVIWTDLALTRDINYYNNIEGNEKGIKLLGKAMCNLVKPNLYDLFMLHAKARGFIVNNKEDADIIYAVNGDIKPIDMDTIIGEYL